MKTWRVFAMALVAVQALSAAAAVQTFSGRLDDPGNSALVGSDLGLPLFLNDLDKANNVALHAFTLGDAGQVDFKSLGYAVGGADPYFTLFAGAGNGATFRASNFDTASTVGGDFLISLALDAGDYTIAMGVYTNMSFAENLATGTLGDGFIGLGDPNLLRSSFYDLQVTTPDRPLPLPGSAALAVLALGLLAACGRRAVA